MLFDKISQTLGELQGEVKNLTEKINVLQNSVGFLQAEIQKPVPPPEPVSDPQIPALTEAVEDMERQLNRQSASLEDLLDEFQEQQFQRDNGLRRQIEQDTREQALLAWAALEREQLRLLRNTLLSDAGMPEDIRSAWASQFARMEADSARIMARCGVQETGAAGDTFNTETHEIFQILDAPEPDLDGIIAGIYSPGLLYCGRLLQKAKVTIYRWRETVSENPAT